MRLGLSPVKVRSQTWRGPRCATFTAEPSRKASSIRLLPRSTSRLRERRLRGELLVVRRVRQDLVWSLEAVVRRFEIDPSETDGDVTEDVADALLEEIRLS